MASRDNAVRNGVTDKLRICLPPAFPAMQADVLLANILAGPLMSLAPSFAAHLKPGGRLVLSGILKTQEADIRRAYQAEFAELETQAKDDWIRIVGRRR